MTSKNNERIYFFDVERGYNLLKDALTCTGSGWYSGMPQREPGSGQAFKAVSLNEIFLGGCHCHWERHR